MTKRVVRIAYRSETVEIEVNVCRQDPIYAGPFPPTQNHKNRHAYARTELRTHESKLCT